MARQLEKDRRREPRRPIETETLVHYTVAGEFPLPRTAKIVDICSGGIGIMSKELGPGMILLFDQENALEIPARGMVVWTLETRMGQRVGVQFLS
ncbi:MAG: PilZ domain-containing protein [Thermodesulfobacteriota bacterium]